MESKRVATLTLDDGRSVELPIYVRNARSRCDRHPRIPQAGCIHL